MKNAIGSGSAMLLAFVALLACARSGLTAPDAWIRAAPPGAQVTALYFTLRNSSERSEVLVAVETPAAHRVTIHETGGHEGMSGMRPRDRVLIAPGQTVQLAPGGLHVMLEGLERDLIPGEQVPVTLRFASGAVVPVAAVVRPLGAQ